MKIGVSNGKRGNTRTRRLRRQTQGSRLSVFCPKQVTLCELSILKRASKLHCQEDMVGGCDVKEDQSTTATRTTLVSSHMIRSASGEKGRMADLLSVCYTMYSIHCIVNMYIEYTMPRCVLVSFSAQGGSKRQFPVNK